MLFINLGYLVLYKHCVLFCTTHYRDEKDHINKKERRKKNHGIFSVRRGGYPARGPARGPAQAPRCGARDLVWLLKTIKGLELRMLHMKSRMSLSENFVITGNGSVIETSFFHSVTINEGYNLALTGFSSGSICNVTSKNNIIYILSKDGADATVPITPSYYHTVGELLTAIHLKIDYFLKHVWSTSKVTLLKYAIRTNTWTLTMPSGFYITTCRRDPENILNLMQVEDGNFETISVIESTFHEDIKLGFLYCSIVQESNINDLQSRLLDIIPLKVNSMYILHEPVNLKYHKIAIEQFNSISFEVRDSYGDLIEFSVPNDSCDYHATSFNIDARPVVLSLHIKRGI